MQTIDIARLCPKARNTAMIFAPRLPKNLTNALQQTGFSSRVMTVQASMDNLPFSPDPLISSG